VFWFAVPQGEGVAHFRVGHKYVGGFKEGKMFGRGRYDWVDGIAYEGEFRDNVAEGTGGDESARRGHRAVHPRVLLHAPSTTLSTLACCVQQWHRSDPRVLIASSSSRVDFQRIP
jgi:hypothetical protein